MSRNNQQNDGILIWVFIAFVGAASLFFLAWMAASHKIVYYSAKLFDVISFPWRFWPTESAAQVVADLDMNYVLAMRHGAYVQLFDWIDYGNLALKPWSFVFCGLIIFLTWRHMGQMKGKIINKVLGPAELAKVTSGTFSEIAPVLAIQEDLIHNKLKGWRRQTFPMEMLEELRYQGQSVFVPTEHGDRTLDTDRLRGSLSQTKKHKVQGVPLRSSHWLGRQLVNLKVDFELIKGKKTLRFMDRLSNEGKAIYSILAPYAFDKKNGRKRSAKVKDALNYSAYGSKDGTANLSVADEAFQEWREHPEANRLALKHHWEYPFLCALLELAQRRGKMGTWQFIWLKPMCRIMFYSLNTMGRATPHAESAMCFSQWQFDLEVAKQGRLPVDREMNSIIYTDKVVDSFNEEWKFWLTSTPDSKEGDYAFDYDENSDGINALIEELKESQSTPHIPKEANID